MVFPRGGELMREFAAHMSSGVKQLVEDDETGAQTYRYVRIGTDHYSLAFTYDCVAWSRESAYRPFVWVCSVKNELDPSNIAVAKF